MVFSSAVKRAGWAAVLIAVASHAQAAGLYVLDDGLDGTDGHLKVPVDDYGSFGRNFPNGVNDWFQPPGYAPSYPSYMSGAFLFVTNGTGTSSVLFSEYDTWAGYLEAPPNEDGLVGAHQNLARTITTPIGGTPTNATSAFEVTATGFAIHVGLTQTITTNTANATSLLTQVYRFRNDGTGPVDLVFHAAWEVDLYYESGPQNGYGNDIVGVVPGLCAVYIRNPSSTTVAVAMASGSGTTVAAPYYYGGKRFDVPSMGTAATDMQPLSVADANQRIWVNHGMPVSWRNYVSYAGYNTVGDSGTVDEDATMGLEWHFTLAAGAEETIDVRRHYGTIAVPCGVPASCGNSTLDQGEPCDGADTPTCNGGTCQLSACGDGYWNQMAEACETGGVDSDSCNGDRCTAPVCGDGYLNAAANELCDPGEETAECNANCQPAACGDGYINAAAGEECEAGALCDVATCTVAFTVGGGCAGCGARDDSSTGLWLAGLALVLTSRRRRRARRA